MEDVISDIIHVCTYSYLTSFMKLWVKYCKGLLYSNNLTCHWGRLQVWEFKEGKAGRGKPHMNDKNYIYSRLASNVRCLAKIEPTFTINER